VRRNKSISRIAYELLKNKGTPIHYTELTRLIMKKKEIKGRTPWKTVNSVLCRSSNFERFGKGRTGKYKLVEWE